MDDWDGDRPSIRAEREAIVFIVNVFMFFFLLFCVLVYWWVSRSKTLPKGRIFSKDLAS